MDDITFVPIDDSEAAKTPKQRLSAAGNVVRTNLGLLFSIVKEHNLDTDGSLSSPLTALQERCISNEIHLAVLGEFSSGKTTFVNALLNTNILEAGILPTTAVCTTVRFGVKPQCLARLKSGKLLRIEPEDLGTFSTAGARSSEVDEVIVELPSSLLANGLVIVDTPGVNVNIDVHETITSNAIARANACVYLMDARQPGKKTTIDFLRQIRQKVDKFFFVLNRADILDQSEQKEALDYVRNALIHECGISNPRIELLSSLPSSGAIWSDCFEAFKQKLNDFMVSERDSVICTELARLLDDVIVRSEHLLESKFRLAEQELSEHYKTSIPDAAQIINSLRGQLDSIVSGDAAKAQSRFYEFHNSVCGDLRQSVEHCISSPFTVETLVNVAPKQISQAFETHAAQLDEFVGNLLRIIFTTRQAQVAGTVRQMFSNVRWLDQRAFFTRLGIWFSVASGALMLFGIEYAVGAPSGCVKMSPFLGATAGAVVYGTYYWARSRSLFSPERLPNPGYGGYVQATIGGGTLFQRAASNPIQPNTAPIQIGRVAGNLAGNPWLAVAGGAISGAIYGAQLLWDKVSGKLGNLRKEIRNSVTPVLNEFESETRTGGSGAIASGRDGTIAALCNVLDKSMERYQVILDGLVKPHKRIRMMLEQRRDRLHDDTMRLRTSRQLVVESLRTLEMELNGVFSYHREPEWTELDMPARNQDTSGGDLLGIPLLKPEDIDFEVGEVRSSGYYYGTAAGNAISRTFSQPLVLGWVGCLLVSAVLTVASLKAAGALPFRPEASIGSASTISSASNGSAHPLSNGPTATVEAKPSPSDPAFTTDTSGSQTEPQATADPAVESPGTDSQASAASTVESNPTNPPASENNNSAAAYNPSNEPNPQDARRLNSQALQMLSQSPPDLFGAMHTLEAAVRLDPSDVEIQNNLGDVCGRVGNYRSAESVLTWVVSVAPTRRVAQGNLGYVEAKLGKVVDASNHLCAYVRLFKSFEQGKSTLVRVMNDPDPNVQSAVRLTMNNCTE